MGFQKFTNDDIQGLRGLRFRDKVRTDATQLAISSVTAFGNPVKTGFGTQVLTMDRSGILNTLILPPCVNTGLATIQVTLTPNEGTFNLGNTLQHGPHCGTNY